MKEGGQALAEQMIEQMVQQQGGQQGGAGGGQGAPQDMLAQQGAEAAQAPTPFGPPGIPGADGMGMNPNEGGLPAQMMQPGATREAQTGMTNTGEEALGL